jgi:hypothetical protein
MTVEVEAVGAGVGFACRRTVPARFTVKGAVLQRSAAAGDGAAHFGVGCCRYCGDPPQPGAIGIGAVAGVWSPTPPVQSSCSASRWCCVPDRLLPVLASTVVFNQRIVQGPEPEPSVTLPVV